MLPVCFFSCFFSKLLASCFCATSVRKCVCSRRQPIRRVTLSSKHPARSVRRITRATLLDATATRELLVTAGAVARIAARTNTCQDRAALKRRPVRVAGEAFKAAAAVAAAATSRLRQQNGARRRETGDHGARGRSRVVVFGELSAGEEHAGAAARSASLPPLVSAPAAARPPAPAGPRARPAPRRPARRCSAAHFPRRRRRRRPCSFPHQTLRPRFAQARQSAASFSASAARFWIRVSCHGAACSGLFAAVVGGAGSARVEACRYVLDIRG